VQVGLEGQHDLFSLVTSRVALQFLFTGVIVFDCGLVANPSMKHLASPVAARSRVD